MASLPPDLRLFIAIALNAIVLAGVARVVYRRGIRDGAQLSLDSLLGWYLVQYFAIGITGLLGVMSFVPISLAALACVGALQLIPQIESGDSQLASRDRAAIVFGGAIVIGMIAATIVSIDAGPILSNDALTYHLPAAASWLQTHRIGLFATWYFNPANTYSPLAGSMFIAWWMAPLGNDVLARFTAAPPLFMLFLTIVQAMRGIGVEAIRSVLIALAVVLARPFISQVMLAKDDLFVAAFFATIVVSITRNRLSDRLGTWRLGTALGLFFATKYTALLSAPMLLLALDVPFRSGPRRRECLLSLVIACVIALPWFIRNALLTGNPLFPTTIRINGFTLLKGMFIAHRSDRLIGLGNIVHTLTNSTIAGYFNLSIATWIVLLVAWLLAIVQSRRAIVRDAMTRVILLGPPIGFAAFILISPYAETRFTVPSQLLLFLVIGISFRGSAGTIVAAFVAGISITTAFTSTVWLSWLPTVLACVAIAMAFAFTFEIVARAAQWRKVVAVLWTTTALAIGGAIYANFGRYVETCRQTAVDTWPYKYGEIAEGWRFIRESVPPAESIAYANTFFVYPLMSFDLAQRVVYVSMRQNVNSISDLGEFDSPATEETILTQMTALMNRNANEAIWKANFKTSGATKLFIAARTHRSFYSPIDTPIILKKSSKTALFKYSTCTGDARVRLREGKGLFGKFDCLSYTAEFDGKSCVTI